jgi:hypothetical protein
MRDFIGWGLLSLAALIAAFNFYLSFLRGLIYRLMGWEYRWVSGIPVIGSICLALALLCISLSPAVWLCASLIAVFDTAGIPWFILVMFLAAFVWSKPVDADSKKTPD